MELKFSYNEAGTRKVFHKFHAQQETLRAHIEAHLREQVANGLPGIKLASRLPFHGNKIYECRVNPGPLPALRVAFTLDQTDVCIVFISTDIQKSVFSRDMDRFIRRTAR